MRWQKSLLEGLGATFLEETFSASTAPAAHRCHQKAAQAILKALLPDAGTNIKGSRQSYEALLHTSGYAQKPREFEDLIQILDNEIRLITPTTPAGEDVDDHTHDRTSETTEPGAEPTAQREKYYQLTHDYLVSSLRDWLTRKQKETRRGRAELKLAERSALWNAKPENRHLPSLSEFLGIRTLSKPKDWSEPQRKMMTRARNIIGLRSAVAIGILVIAAVTGLAIRNRLRDMVHEQLAQSLVQQVLTADRNNTLSLIGQLAEYRDVADPALRRAVANNGDETFQKLNASLALLPVDPYHANFLVARLGTATPDETRVIRASLNGNKIPEDVAGRLWSDLEGITDITDNSILPLAGTLALLCPDDAKWKLCGPKAAEALVRANPVYLGGWLELLQDARRKLALTLAEIHSDRSENRAESQREWATTILRQYAADRPRLLAELLITGDAKQFTTLIDVAALPENRRIVIDLCRKELQIKLAPDWNDLPLKSEWRKPDAALQTRIETAQGTIAARCAFCQAMPRAT